MGKKSFMRSHIPNQVVLFPTIQGKLLLITKNKFNCN